MKALLVLCLLVAAAKGHHTDQHHDDDSTQGVDDGGEHEEPAPELRQVATDSSTPAQLQPTVQAVQPIYLPYPVQYQYAPQFRTAAAPFFVPHRPAAVQYVPVIAPINDPLAAARALTGSISANLGPFGGGTIGAGAGFDGVGGGVSGNLGPIKGSVGAGLGPSGLGGGVNFGAFQPDSTKNYYTTYNPYYTTQSAAPYYTTQSSAPYYYTTNSAAPVYYYVKQPSN